MAQEGSRGPRQVRKRDGRTQRFEKRKVVESLLRACRSAGKNDPRLAAELAEVVCVFLERHSGEEVLRAQEIHAAIEKVLQETDQLEVAQAFGAFFAWKARARQRLLVRGEDHLPFPPPAGGPLQVFREGSATGEEWTRAKLQRALVEEVGLDELLAESVARAVENRVFAARITSLSKRLIRELVDNELFERGIPRTAATAWLPAIRAQEVESVLAEASPGRPLHGLATLLGETFLRARVFSRELVAAMDCGRILPEAPGDLLAMHSACVDAGSLLRRERALSPRRQVQRLGQAVRLLRECCRHGVTLVGLGRALFKLAPQLGSARRRLLEDVLLLLAGPPQELCAPPHTRLQIDGRGRHADGELLECWAERGGLEGCPGVAPLLAGDGGRLQGAISWLSEQAVGVASAPERGVIAMDFFRRARPPGLVLPGVYLNLPQAAFRSERSDLDAFFEVLDRDLETALLAHAERRDFLLAAAATGGALFRTAQQGGFEKLVGELDRALAPVYPVGLNEATLHLTGRDPAESEEAGQGARQILAHLDACLREKGRPLGIRARVAEAPGMAGREGGGPSRRVRQHFTRTDEALFPAARRLFVSEGGMRTGYSLSLGGGAEPATWRELVERGRFDHYLQPLLPLEIWSDRTQLLPKETVELAAIIFSHTGLESFGLRSSGNGGTGRMTHGPLLFAARQASRTLTLFDLARSPS